MKNADFKKICVCLCVSVCMYHATHVLQDFPCPITLGQWEACDWTGEGRQREELRRQKEKSEEERENQNEG